MSAAADSVPVIDIAPAFGADPNGMAAVARAVDAACREWGFLIISGHGVPPALLQEMDRVTRAFFELPLAARLQVEMPKQPGRRGYFGFAQGANGRLLGIEVPPDLRESFRMGRDPVPGDPYYTTPEHQRFFKPNLWPASLPEMQDVWERYFAAVDGVARRMLRIFSCALALPEDYFDDKVDRSASELVAQYYPQLREEPLPNQLRNAAHTDFGTITILKSEDRPNGLQVAGRDGEWYAVIPVAGAFIVNIGDMLAQWTNDRWRSTMHRVVNPTGAESSNVRRLSIAYFHEPNPDAMIETIPSCIDREHPQTYAPVLGGAYMARKLDLVQGVNNAV